MISSPNAQFHRVQELMQFAHSMSAGTTAPPVAVAAPLAVMAWATPPLVLITGTTLGLG